MHAAQLLVQIVQMGRQTRQLAVTLIGLAGHLHGAGQRRREADEAGGGGPVLGERIKGQLRLFDLLDGRRLGVGRVLDDVAADADQVAAQGEVVDDAGVVRRIGPGRRAVDQIGEIAQAAELLRTPDPA
jgi:hypothetical protein